MLKYRVNPAYIDAAMRDAAFEQLEEGSGYYGSIPGFQGVWASEATLEETRSELASVLEGWIELGLERQHPLPDVDGIEPALS